MLKLALTSSFLSVLLFNVISTHYEVLGGITSRIRRINVVLPNGGRFIGGVGSVQTSVICHSKADVSVIPKI